MESEVSAQDDVKISDLCDAFQKQWWQFKKRFPVSLFPDNQEFCLVIV